MMQIAQAAWSAAGIACYSAHETLLHIPRWPSALDKASAVQAWLRQQHSALSSPEDIEGDARLKYPICKGLVNSQLACCAQRWLNEHLLQV